MSRFCYWIIVPLAVIGVGLSSIPNAKASELDSLRALLRTASDHQKPTLYWEMGWAFYPTYLDSMEYYFLQAINSPEVTATVRAKSVRGLGVMYYMKSQFEKAIEYELNALSLFSALNYQYGMAKCYNDLGLELSSLKKYKPAVAYHWKSMGIAQQELAKGNLDADTLYLYRKLLGQNYINLAVNRNEDATAAKDSALYYADRAIDTFQILGDSFYIAMAQNRKAQAFFELGEFDKTIAINRSLLLNFPNLSVWETLFTYLYLARSYHAIGNTEASLQYGERGFALADSVQGTWHAQNFALILAESFEAIAQYQKAYQYYKMYKTLSDTLFNQEKEQRINTLMLRQKELENEKLLQENALQEEHITTQNLQISLFAVVVAGLIAFVVLKVRNEQTLKRLNAELNDANATKDTFFSILAHDLKSPFNSIVGFVHLLRKQAENLSKEEIKEFAELMFKSVSTTYKLLENLLAWARLQTGSLALNLSTISLDTIVHNNLKLLQETASQKGVQLATESNLAVKVTADENMLDTILRNLLSNAIKFTKSGGKVVVYITKYAYHVEVAVKDTGVGISSDRLAKLFLLTEKQSTEGTASEQGTGLGLVLCKEFVEKQGGTLTVESQEGVGSTFRFTLPLVE